MGEIRQSKRLDTQLYSDVFNASPIGIVVENLDGQPLFVNPAFCSMLGFNQDELRSKHCVDFSPPEDAEKDWALFQQLRAGSIDHYQIEKRYFRRDGSLVWGSLSISLLRKHPSPLVIAMVEDITDKKRAEEALRTSEERLRLAQQAARIGTFEWNIQTGVNTWTPELEAMYGLPPRGFGGTQTAFTQTRRLYRASGILQLRKNSCDRAIVSMTCRIGAKIALRSSAGFSGIPICRREKRFVISSLLPFTISVTLPINLLNLFWRSSCSSSNVRPANGWPSMLGRPSGWLRRKLLARNSHIALSRCCPSTAS
jgi:PAS domain S-box-containing protein